MSDRQGVDPVGARESAGPGAVQPLRDQSTEKVVVAIEVGFPDALLDDRFECTHEAAHAGTGIE